MGDSSEPPILVAKSVAYNDASGQTSTMDPTVSDFYGNRIVIVKDDTTKPSPTEYPALLPTLQTWVGMVLGNGDPTDRAIPSGTVAEEVE